MFNIVTIIFEGEKMMKQSGLKKAIFALSFLASFSYAAEYDAVKGEMLSLSCVNCHGVDGKSKTAIPSIAGLDKEYLNKTLLEYKNGQREDTFMMQKHTKGFSDAELEQLSYYFSKVK